MKAKPRLVLDTNVVVSALLWRGKPGQLIELAGEAEVRLYTSRILLNELAATLSKPKLSGPVAATGRSVTEHLIAFRQLAKVIRPKAPLSPISRDADDDHVLACAVAAKASYIVTGDDDLLVLGSHDNVEIITVASIIDMLNNCL
jgi:uncharacterized protein